MTTSSNLSSGKIMLIWFISMVAIVILTTVCIATGCLGILLTILGIVAIGFAVAICVAPVEEPNLTTNK